MALYIPHSLFNLARLFYVRTETFGTYYVHAEHLTASISASYICTNTFIATPVINLIGLLC